MGSCYSAFRITTTTVADLGQEFGEAGEYDEYGESGESVEEITFEEYVERGGPLQLLEAVYCDPCKAKVSF